MGSIVMPAGTKHVHIGELPELIADALFPCTGLDDGRFRAGYALVNVEEELDMDARAGKLKLRDELTLGPYQVRGGVKIVNALVTVDDLRDYVADRGLTVKVGSKGASKAASEASGNDWKSKAQARAVEIIERQRKLDCYPSQIDVADEIAREFRSSGVTGADGKPLTGASIKRHALSGISSAKGKQVSTSIRRGK